jgi:hypothetical protein
MIGVPMTLTNEIKRIAFTACLISAIFFVASCENKPKGETTTEPKQVAENPETRVSFDQLFDVSGNNVTPKKVIRYSGKTFTPEVPFESNVFVFDGVPFTQLIGHDAEIKKAGDVTEIVKFY